MATIMPEGEGIRKAVKYIDEVRQTEPEKNLAGLIHEACVKFDLLDECLHRLAQPRQVVGLHAVMMPRLVEYERPCCG